MLKCRSYPKQNILLTPVNSRVFFDDVKIEYIKIQLPFPCGFKLSYHIYNIRLILYTCILHKMPNPKHAKTSCFPSCPQSQNITLGTKLCPKRYVTGCASKGVVTCLAKWPASPTLLKFSPSSESGNGGAIRNLLVAPGTNGHHTRIVAKACILPWEG